MQVNFMDLSLPNEVEFASSFTGGLTEISYLNKSEVNKLPSDLLNNLNSSERKSFDDLANSVKQSLLKKHGLKRTERICEIPPTTNCKNIGYLGYLHYWNNFVNDGGLSMIYQAVKRGDKRLIGNLQNMKLDLSNAQTPSYIVSNGNNYGVGEQSSPANKKPPFEAPIGRIDEELSDISDRASSSDLSNYDKSKIPIKKIMIGAAIIGLGIVIYHKFLKK
jgi:hypothetical protein